MKTGSNNVLWAVSLIVLGAAAAVQFGLRLAGVPLPDALARLLGIVCLAALPVLAFTTVRKLRTGKKEGGRQNGGQ